MFITLLLIALVVLLALTAPRFGADSRNLQDHPWEGEQRPAHPNGW